MQMFRCSPVFVAFVRPRMLWPPAGGRVCLTPCQGCSALECVEPVLASFMSEVSLFRSGGDLLSHVLRRSTIGVGALIGRVRDGIGSFAPAMTTRPEKRPGRAFALPKHQGCSRFSYVVYVLLTISDGKVCALLLPDQIKPIGQLVPVS